MNKSSYRELYVLSIALNSFIPQKKSVKVRGHVPRASLLYLLVKKSSNEKLS